MLGFEMATLKNQHMQVTIILTVRNKRKFICSAVYSFFFSRLSPIVSVFLVKSHKWVREGQGVHMFYEKLLFSLFYSFYTAEGKESQSSTEESDIGSLVVKWIMGITTSKLAELIQSLGSLLSEIFNEILEPAKKEKPTSELSDLLEEKIISSFLLSVVLLLIVVVTRTQGA